MLSKLSATSLVVITVVLLLCGYFRGGLSFGPPTSKQVISGVTTSKVGWNAYTCSKKVRVNQYRKVCERNPVHHEEPIMPYIVMDHQEKTVGCLNNKVGTMGWRNFLKKTKDRKVAKSQLETLRNVPLSTFKTAYGNWTKYTLVRHPLQRLVSGYYQAIVVMKAFSKSDGSKMNFTEFAHRLVEQHIANLHWREYNMNCHMCDVDYEYVLKQETLQEDASIFSKSIGLPSNTSIEQRHTGVYSRTAEKNTSRANDHIHKYDALLAEFQHYNPLIMKQIIDMYKYDMELFDYGWDWLQARSVCLKYNNDFSCC